MQFMSESMGWADNIILAMAPLGILTIIVSAIRVGGPSWLKAIIGRARENLSAAEVELMSSISEEVCELWNGRELVRCMGSAPVVEFICLLPRKDETGAETPLTEQWRSSTTLKSFRNLFEFIFPPPKKDEPDAEIPPIELQDSSTKPEIFCIETTELKEVLHEIVNAGNSQAGAESENTSSPAQRRLALNETDDDSLQKFSITRNLDKGSPNVSLNIHGPSSKFELVLAAISGTVLQLGVLVYAWFATYYPSLKFPKDDNPVASYAYPCTTTGTLLLVLGIAICAHVVDSSTEEKEFKAKDGRQIRVVWLQQQKTVSDQVFKSCAIYAEKPQLSIKSSRRDKRAEHQDQKRTQVHSSQGDACDETQSEKTQLGLEMETILGTAVTLSGFVLQFVGLRGMHWSISIAQLGAVLVMVIFKAWVRRRVASPPKIEELVSGFELDWLSKTLGNDAYATFWHWGGQDQKNGCLHDWVILSDKRTKLEDETESTDDQSCAQAILDTRKKLGRVAKWQGFAYNEAVCLSKAIEVTLNTLFTRSESGVGKVKWKWQVPVQCNGTEQEIGLTLCREGNRWTAEIDEIDAALSLWLHSMNVEGRKNTRITTSLAENKGKASLGARTSFKNEELDKSRLNIPSAVQGKRSLGMSGVRLEQDLAWWVPRDSLRTFKLNKNDPELLKNVNLEVGMPSSRNETQEAHGLLEEPANSHDGQDTTEKASNSRNEANLELLAIDFSGSQKMLCAQVLFSLFMRAVAEKLKDPIEGGVDELLPEFTADDEDWKKFQLRNNTLSSMVQDVHQTGLGSLAEVYTSIVTPLSREKKLPQIDKVVEWVREHAEKYARLEDWQRTGECLEWLSKVAETPSTVARAEGVLWDHLRRAILARKFHEEQRIEQGKTAVASLTNLQNSLRLVLMTIRSRQQQPAHQDFMDLAWIFDRKVLDDKPRFPILPTELIEDKFLLRRKHNCYETYPEAFQYTYWHSRALTGWEEDDPESIKYTQRGDAKSKDILDRTPAHYVAAISPPERDDRTTRILSIKELKEDGADLDAQDLLGWTPLHHACWAGNLEQIEDLIQAGVVLDHQARDGVIPLHCAVTTGCQAGESLLVEAGATVDVRNFQGSLPVHLAAFSGYDYIVDILLKSGSRNLQDRFGRTALHQAALAGKKDVIDLFDTRDLEARDRNGQTSLSLAARMGHLNCVRVLLKKGANVHQRDRDGKTHLHWAATSDCIRVLLKNGADVHQRDRDGKTHLHWAATSDCIRVLLKNGADVHSRDRDGKTPLHWAATSDCIHVLLDRGANIHSRDPRGRTPLHLAANSDCVLALLDRGAEIHSRDRDDKTPLHWAATSGHADCIHALLSEGANINPGDENERTPLHMAAFLGHADCIHALLSEGANMNPEDDEKTPLHMAADSGHADCVRELVGQGADVSSMDSMGEIALHQAARLGKLEIVKILLTEKSTIDFQSGEEGTTALMLAAIEGHTDILEYLVEQGADCELREWDHGDGMTALQYAIAQRCPKAVETLIRLGANIEAPGAVEKTPLMFAATEAGYDAAVGQLLASGANVDGTDDTSKTALMLAAKLGNVDAIKQLLDSGADVDGTDDHGKTALMFAAERGKVNAVQQLLDSGADIERTDTAKQTAFSITGSEKVRDLLRSAR